MRLEPDPPPPEGYTSSAHEFDAGDREEECVECALACDCEETFKSSEE